VVPVAEASLSSCPVLPVYGLLEDKTKVHVAGVPLSSIRIDCRLVVLSGRRVVVVVGKQYGKEAQLVLFSSLRANEGRLACGVRYLLVSNTVEVRSPCSCSGSRRRASKLTWCTAAVQWPWAKSPKLCG